MNSDYLKTENFKTRFFFFFLHVHAWCSDLFSVFVSACLPENTEPVQIVSPLHQTEIHENQSVVFSCSLSHKNTQVTWFKDNHAIGDGEKYEISCSDFTHKLKIKNLTLSDEAVYTIKVGERSASSMLFIEGL